MNIFNSGSASKWKKIALAISLVIILNVFFNVGVETFYKMPRWDEYCPQSLYSQAHVDKVSCETAGGAWSENQSGKIAGEPAGWCDPNFTCQKNHNQQLSVYNRNVFVVLTALGALTLVASLFANLPNAVSSGLLYGGVLSMIIGTVRFWSEMQDYLRFAVTGVVLIVLVAIGIKKMKD